MTKSSLDAGKDGPDHINFVGFGISEKRPKISIHGVGGASG